MVSLSDEIPERLKPHLSGMSLGEISIIIDHINNDTYEEFEDYVSECKLRSFKVFFNTNKDLLKTHMPLKGKSV